MRDDALTLYGFTTLDERQLFERLRSVSGVGPKVALSLLSSFAADDLKLAIAEGDDNHDVQYILVTDAPIALDTTPLEFTKSSGRTAGIREAVFHIATGAPTPYVFTHNFDTKNVTIAVFRDSDGGTVYADEARPTVDTVQIGFASAATTDYTVIVRAEVTPD
jgi:hypothetical protein